MSIGCYTKPMKLHEGVKLPEVSKPQPQKCEKSDADVLIGPQNGSYSVMLNGHVEEYDVGSDEFGSRCVLELSLSKIKVLDWKCDNIVDGINPLDEENSVVAYINRTKLLDAGYAAVFDGLLKEAQQYVCPQNNNLSNTVREEINGRLDPYLKEEQKPENTSQTTLDSRCELPGDSGMCRAAVTRFYFDKAAKTCKDYVWGGCGDVKVPFKTMEECEKACYK